MLLTISDKTGKTRGIMFREAIRTVAIRDSYRAEAQRRQEVFRCHFLNTGAIKPEHEAEKRVYETAQNKLMRKLDRAIAATVVTAENVEFSSELTAYLKRQAFVNGRNALTKTLGKIVFAVTGALGIGGLFTIFDIAEKFAGEKIYLSMAVIGSAWTVFVASVALMTINTSAIANRVFLDVSRLNFDQRGVNHVEGRRD